MKNKKTISWMISRMTKQSLRAGRIRNVFVMSTIALASALLTVILLFAAGQKQQEKNELSRRAQAGFYHLTKEQAEMLKLDSRTECCIQAKTGIPTQMDGFAVLPYYVNELSEQIQAAELESGRMPEKENEIAVQAALLEKMGAVPAAGSSASFHFSDGCIETFTVSGILKGSGSAGQFSVFFSEHYAKYGSQLKEEPYEVHVKISGAQAMGPEEFKETVYRMGSSAGIERRDIIPSRAFLNSLSIDTRLVLLYGLAGTVILLACVLVIYGVFYQSVIGRIHQFGQLRTIGMTKKQTKKFVSREGGLLFLRSAPVGISIGAAAGYGIIPEGFSIVHTFWIVLFVFAVIYLITMLSVRRPARFAAAVSPMEALRYVPQDGMEKAADKIMCRSLTPLGLGRMNFSKNKKKAAVTMLSLALGGILFMTAAVYISSFDKENYARQGYFAAAEFHISYSLSAIEQNPNGISGLQAEAPLSGAMLQDISALDGVKKVDEIKSFGIRFDYPKQGEYNSTDQVYPLTGEELKGIEKYLEEGSWDYGKLMSGSYILASGNDTAEEIYGWRFHAGDRITLHYYDGSRMCEKEVTILGILSGQFVLDHPAFEGWFLMPQQVILDLVSYDSLNAHLLVSTEADREAEIGEALAQMAAQNPQLSLETLAERKTAYGQTADQVFGAVSGLAAFIMMFSIFSMMNTLITNIVTRKQELAVLESIGMSRGQIRKMLLWESLLLTSAAIGAALTAGTACGFALTRILYSRGAFYMAFRFPYVFVSAYAGVLFLVPLAITLLLMNSFSKEGLVERLRGAENG